MNKSMIKAGLLALLFLPSLAFAAGEIDFVTGGVTVMSAQGELRVPSRGQRVEPGDTVVTGRDGEVHLVMDDSGLIAIRPATRLKIESYVANGGAEDSVVLNLFRGTFRSITGWIGKNDPGKYTVRTPSATIGIRGTDHEPLVVDEGPDAGTYDKVNSGGTSLTTPFGKVDIAPQQAGFVPRGAPVAPKVLAVVPPAFKPTANEAAIDKGKADLEKVVDEKLRLKRVDNERRGAGPAGAVGGTRPLLAQAAPRLGDAEDARKAGAALDDILRAYEQGNNGYFRTHLNPSMIGLQKLLDDIIRETNVCKQMRVLLLDKQVQAGPDLAVIQTNWQKRCLLLPGLTPQLVSGHATFLMHREAGGWSMAAVSGGNPFTPIASTTNVLATLTVVNGATYAAAAIRGGAAALPFRITVVDPDRAGTTSVTVQITTADRFVNDAMTVTLLPVSPGSPQFTVATVNFGQSRGGCTGPSPAINPNSLEICPNTTVTVRYTDTTTPSGTQTVLYQGLIP